METVEGTIVEPGTSTQVAHPWQAVKRTLTTYVLPAIALLLGAIPIIQETVGAYLPESWIAWLVGAVGVLGAIQLLLTRLMALASAQHALTKVGLGTGVEKEPPIAGRPVESDYLD